MNSLDRNQDKRDAILAPFFEAYDRYMSERHGSWYTGGKYMGGTRYYRGLTIDVLNKLLAKGFVDFHESQNDSPTIEEFHKLMERFPQLTAHGYAVEAKRCDYRFSIEGIECDTDITLELRLAVAELCHNADEYENTAEYIRVRWD